MQRLRFVAPLAALLAVAIVACHKAPSDQTLTTGIQAKLYIDPTTKPANVSVAVRNGVAILTGDVPDAGIVSEAMKVASDTPGVKSVTNQMTINGVPATQQAAATSAPPPYPSSTPAPGVSTPPPSGQGSYPPLPTATGPATPAPQQPAPGRPAVAPPSQAPSQSPPPQEPVSITIPAGEHVTVRMIDSIDSKRDTAGQVFRATLAAPLVSHGRVVAPAGTPGSVLLTQARSAGRIHGRSELEVRLYRIEYQGRSYPVDSSVYEEQGNARGKQTAVRTGIGAAAGAIIGALAGGGKGAAIGSAAGGGAGLGVNVFTHGQQVKIPSEAVLTFRLRRSLLVRR